MVTFFIAGLSRAQDIYGTTVSINVYDPEVYGTEDKSGGLTTIISGYTFDREHTNAVGVGWFVSKFCVTEKLFFFVHLEVHVC